MKAYKVCYKCGLSKHISLFYSNSNKCKVCWNSDAKLHKEVKDKMDYFNMDKKICQICNEIFPTLELANLHDHKYTDNPKDYMLLCPSCHFLYDKITNSRNGF